MKLDKDIHSKLVNPHTSSTLEKNVKNVMIALNSKAPYDKLIKMIENIRVWLAVWYFNHFDSIWVNLFRQDFIISDTHFP